MKNEKARMKIFIAAVLSLVSLVIIFSAMTFTFAQTTLLPGSTTFSSEPIQIAELELLGTLDFLRVYWNASYLSGTTDNLSVRCYINCNPLTDAGKCDGKQNCTFVGPPGPGVCSIQPISYNHPLDANPNLAVCIFYNPANPTIEYKKPDGTYPNRTFQPINFELAISPNFTVTVGQQFSMQINVKNVGIFTDNYHINVSAEPANLVAFDERTKSVTVGPLTGSSYGNFPQTFASIARMRVLSTATPINIIILANSTTNETITRVQAVQIRAGVSSLPDFGLLGLVQIILLAAVILFLKLK